MQPTKQENCTTKAPGSCSMDKTKAAGSCAADAKKEAKESCATTETKSGCGC